MNSLAPAMKGKTRLRPKARRKFSLRVAWPILVVALLTAIGWHGQEFFAGLTGNAPLAPAAPSVSPIVVEELLRLNQEQLKNCDIAWLDLQACLAALDHWSTRVKSETERHRRRFQSNPTEFENSEGYFRMLMMAVVLYEDFGIRYNPARISSPEGISASDGFFANSEDVFLHGLLGRRRMGTCSSMPVLYVALARRLGYPVKLVTTKGHLFLRWESATERFNLEATGRGMNRYDDEHYRQWPFPLTDEEIQAHGYLKSLSAAEELAVFLGIRGQCLVETGRLAEGGQSFEAAARLAPQTTVYRMLFAEAQAKLSATAYAQSVVPEQARLLNAAGQPPEPPMHLPVPSGPDPNPLLRIR